jgi:protein gp37
VKASVRFLSCEPLFEEVKLKEEWLQNVEWVIAGGESGNKARVANPDWFRSLRDQSVEAGIPFHFKQWGEWDENMNRIGKKKAGRVLDGRTWDEHP